VRRALELAAVCPHPNATCYYSAQADDGYWYACCVGARSARKRKAARAAPSPHETPDGCVLAAAPLATCMQANWRQYNAKENTNLAGHLMTYPFEMPDLGVTVDPALEDVPDFPGASFAGKATKLPDVLTT
jgi:Phospholipase D C terminal